jgi:RNA 2',3'-cyclic 3'-phosphodiesterase
MLRLFFALQPTAGQSADLVAAVAPLIAGLGGQPVLASNLHATLCFVGAVAEETLPLLKSAAAQVRARPMTLDFAALEYWEAPEVLCATAETPRSARDLSIALGEAAVAVGFTPDLKPLRPHLTLARKVRRAVAQTQIWPRELASPVRMHCERFVLMESRREDAGSIYSVVDSWPLYGDETR